LKRTCISLRKYICSQFKPNVAKVIYDRYKCKNVLDFSAGWGDRLAGFYASDYGELFVGIDPRKENHPIYKQQAEFYQKHSTFFETEKKSEFICEPAEDANLSKYEGMMDIVFTSPPYFTVERYSYDDTQSWVRYKNIDLWNENFLQKAVKKAWKCLRKGGILLVNISDVNATSNGKKEWLRICRMFWNGTGEKTK
jgi:tRNA1(Val) A37 N6-methylase TrmN6